MTVVMAIASTMTMAACGGTGKTVSKVYVDDKNHLIVEYSDGTTQDFGVSQSTGAAKTIVETSVNEEKHLIVKYSDGSTEDLGYVGVEVVPPLYTVTFVDINGNVLSTQQVYKGLAAKAPEAPQIADQIFSGWDKDITNIQGDITVSPTYGNMASFKVTFKDEQGNVLEEQTVISGRAATAPSTPEREDTIFDRWDKSFSNVTEDIVVTAIYRQKKECTVTFKDYSGIVLGTAKTKEGDGVTAPVTPSRDGYKFTGWSGSISAVYSDTTVTAKYTRNSGSNIFDIAYSVSGDTVTVTLELCGDVRLCGFEGTISFEGMTVKSFSKGSLEGIVINQTGNAIKMAFGKEENITKGASILTVTLTKTADQGKADLTLAKCFETTGPQQFSGVNATIIGENIKLK